MLAAVLAVALSQWGPEPSPGMLQYDPGAQCQRTGGRCFLNRSGNRPRENYAFFEFAPASGAGMGTACACTTPTGAKGETMTFTRTGDATCSKQGLATTGIANGDLVVCTANQPRVESSGGVLGLRVEGARTNSVLRSQELDNAAWADDSSPVSPITITANAATAPDGTLTAERFQIPSRTAAQWSLRYQVVATGVSGSTSVYVKGNGQSGVFSIAHGASLSSCVDCAFDASTWTRCELGSVTGGYIWLGTVSGYGSCAGGTKPAVDAFIWGAQTEGAGVATYPTSYIPTVASAVTRNAELASFPLVPSSVVSGSMAVSVELLATATNGVLSATAAGAFRQSILTFGGSRAYVGGASLVGPLAALTAGGVRRAAMWWDGVSTNLILNGASTAGAAGAPAATDRLQVGNYDSTTVTNEPGIYTLICYDPASSRCR